MWSSCRLVDFLSAEFTLEVPVQIWEQFENVQLGKPELCEVLQELVQEPVDRHRGDQPFQERPELSPLPSSWAEFKAPTGYMYFYNRDTKQSTYARPITTLPPMYGTNSEILACFNWNQNPAER